MSVQKAVTTVVRPKVEKMRKIINKAAQAGSLIRGELIKENRQELYDDDSQFGMAAPPTKCANISRCAMGELLFKIGYSNKELRGFDFGGGWGQVVYQELWDAYKIDAKDVSKIISGNDSTVGSCSLEDFAKRARKLDKVLTKLDKEAKRVNPHLTRLDNDGTALGPLPSKKEIEVMKKFGVYEQYESDVLDEVDSY